MKRRIIGLLSLCAILCFGFWCHAAASEWLSSSDITRMRGMIGEFPSDIPQGITSFSTAKDVICILDDMKTSMTVDDKLETLLRLVEEAEETAGLKQDLLAIREQLDEECIQPLTYYYEQLSSSVLRLESLLDLLEDPDAGLNELEQARYASECRFLEDLINNRLREALQFRDSADDAVSRADEAISALRNVDETIRPILDQAAETSREIRNAEQAQLSQTVQGLDASFEGTQKDASITVIDSTQFGVVLTTGPDEKDVLTDVDVTAISAKGASLNTITVKTDRNGTATFDVTDFPFQDKKGRAYLKIDVKGYRKVIIKNARVEAGKAFTIPMAKDDGTPYLMEASIQGDDMLFDKDNGICYIMNNNTTYTMSFMLANMPKNSEGTISMQVLDKNVAEKDQLVVDIADYEANSDGEIEITKKDSYAGKLQVKEKGEENAAGLKLIVKKKDDTEVASFVLAQTIERAPFESPIQLNPTLPSMTQGMLSLKIPSYAPVFTNPSLDIGVPKMPHASFWMDIDGAFIAAFGMKGNPNINETSTIMGGATKEDRNASVDDVKNRFNEQIESYKNMGDYTRKDGKVQKVGLAKGFKFDFTLAGGVTGKISWLQDYKIKNRIPWKATAFGGVTVGFSYRYTQQFFTPTTPPIPYYAGFDARLSVTGGGQFSVEGTFDNQGDLYQDETKVMPLLEFNLAPRVDVGVSAGLGISGIATIGVRGYGSFTAVFDFQPKVEEKVSGNIYWQLIIGLGMDIEARALLWTANLHLISASIKIDKTPTPFYDEQKKLSSSTAELRQSAAGDGTVGQNSGSLSDLPTQNEVLSLTASEYGSCAVGGENDQGGIAPERETLFDGRFDLTNLKSVTVDNGQGGYVDFIFSAGNKNPDDPGYECIMYASPEGDNLELRGAIYAKDIASPWPTIPSFAYQFLTEFDVSYNTSENLVYVLAICGFEKLDIMGLSLYGTVGIVQAYTVSEDGKSLIKQYEYTLIPVNENGNPIRVNLAKPTVVVSDFKFSARNYRSGCIAMIGTDLDDNDIKGEALGHTKGTYLYVGGADENKGTFQRYNDARLEEDDEVLQIIFLPNCQTYSGKSGLMVYETVVLTGAVKNEQTVNEESSVIESNRLYVAKITIATNDDLNDKGYIPRDFKKAMYNNYAFKAYNDLQISSIMPGLDESQMLAVRAVEGSEASEDGGQETTLDGYNFKQSLGPVIEFDTTNYGFTTSMNWFGVTKVAGGHYLYWLQDFDADENDPNNAKPKHVIRCCLYDRDSKCFTDPFDLVALSWSPRTVALTPGASNTKGNAAGLYTVDAPEYRFGAKTAWSFVDVEYTLKSSLDLVAFAGQHCVTAGEKTTFTLTVDNTGNTIIAAFDVKLTDKSSGELLGNITIDTTKQENCSVQLYDLNGREDDEPVYKGDYHAVYCASAGEYGGCSRLVLKTTAADGTLSTNEVVSLGIVPTHQTSYCVEVTIPESWKKSDRTVLAEISNLQTPPDNENAIYVSQQDTEDLDPNVFSEREIAAAMEAVAPEQMRQTNVRNHSKASSLTMKPVYEDLKLDLNLVEFPDGTYVEALITSLNDELPADSTGKRAKPPTLTFTKVEADGKEEVTFRHTFANSITSKRGYTMLIPLDLVDGDGVYKELVGTVTGNSGYSEYSIYNNSESIEGVQHSIRVLTEGPGQAYAQNSKGSKITTALFGDRIQLIALPDKGASLVEWQTDGPEIGEDGSFLMPAYDVTVTAVFGPPLLIVKDPEDVWIYRGEKGTFEIYASGEGLTYQWYENRTFPESRKTETGWKLIEGATNPSYTTGIMTTDCDGYLYRCVVTDKYGRQVTSGAAMLHVSKKLPPTGDKGNPVLWIALVLAGAEVALAVKRKIRNRS